MDNPQENKSYLHHLHDGVPYHQLIDMDVNTMSDEEIRAFVPKLRAVRTSPAEKKKLRNQTAETLKGGLKVNKIESFL